MRTQPAATGFLGVPVHADLATLDADVAFLGIPYGVPYDMRGVHSDAANAPAAVRGVSQRFAGSLDHHDFDLDGPLVAGTGVRLVDCGDVPGDPRDLEGTARRATEAVGAILGRGALPLIVGGDDSIPPLALRAYAGRGPVNVVQVDAHLDFRDEVGGIPDGYSSPIRRIRELPWVGRILQVGLRGVGSARPADVAAARAAGNVLVTAEEVHANGAGWVVDQLPAGEAVFVTVDCDGLDPSIAVGTGYPLPGGLSFSEAAALLRGVASRGRLVGMDVTEYCPSLDARDLTALTIVRLLANVVGVVARRRGSGAAHGHQPGR